jgi:phage terminase large subunit-like protein
MRWRTRARHARAIRFIESYCVAPKGYGAGKAIRLAPFQKEWLEEVLAPGVHAAVESMPRGNGKSTFKAALGCWAGFDPGESGDPQVPIIATTIKQGTKTIYGPLLKMIGANPELADRCKVYTALSDSKVIVPFTGGEIFPIADDPDGLQGLDPSLGMVDEIGFMSVESWASLLLATGKRPDSLIIAIGTPGFDEDNALWHIRKSHLEGEPEVHFTEYAADEGCSIRDEAQWRKSNPAFVAGFKGEHAFRIALSLPEPLFRIFQLGQWVGGVQCWLGTDGRRRWEKLADPWSFETGGDTWVTVDMSRTRDSAAVVALQRRPDGRLHAKAKIWHPQDSPTGVVDGMAVMNHLRDLDRRYHLIDVGFDPRFFEERAGMLEAERLPMVEFPQSLERMTPACGDTYELIVNGAGLSHDGDPEYRRQILAAVPKLNERGFTLKKKTPESPNKIDAAVATCMAVALANRYVPRKAEVCVL